ncbi:MULTISPECIES: 5'-3' exonuclease [Mammaliicoccus]|jgi:5'-3' exonuclease|uniref:5'-3' exonuclease n=1 Tax=Mammaliicoccus sciuri TaxID=1296 RepID=A0AAW5LL85_MAMSC|nr:MULTISPECIES: 5'-3' exonuclease H3TH domain-containing protein [Mammaliicoccus]KTT84379.1 5'-3' exonuclease [Mammaliicoccus sciuri]MBA1396492.1 5'-3' exonuclease [Mammaliicoccus sciuri]MBF0774551.1 5'-3' exonuclease [Mammaliicoccus sciuri]MBG9205166.1 5'-3' exonuclease [Mammaliicoccus sciuri]MBG9210090.1 5'-3' exonuclease [Mammaliicoccus sciuri]
MSNKILLIDGMALLFRHFYATSIHKQFMRDSKGIPTNAVQGFIRHSYTVINDIKPTHVAVCWDMGSKTFRNDMFEAYKSNRVAPPEEMIPQFDRAKEIAEKLGLLNLGITNYEADDVIGTISKRAQEKGHETYVVSGDRDLLQCINTDVDIWLTKKGFNIYNKYDIHKFREEYGLEPHQLVDVKAFMGDTADGYPGVKGIGEKTAIKLIQQYQSVENVLENINELTAGQQKKIITYRDDLAMSKQLAQIHTDVPLETEDLLNQMTYRHEIEQSIEICNEHELFVSSKYLTTNFL